MTLLNKDFKNKNILKILYIFIISFFMSFSFFVPVFAEEEEEDTHFYTTKFGSALWDGNVLSSDARPYSYAALYNDSEQTVGIYYKILTYKGSDNKDVLFICVDESDFQSLGTTALYFRVWTSNNPYNYNTYSNLKLDQTFTASSTTDNHKTIRYATSGQGNSFYNIWANRFSLAHVVSLSTESRTLKEQILGAFSTEASPPYPWNGSNSSGGRYWSDGTQLSSQNTAKYSQIYIVMDTNSDNSVSQEEVNYYNYTYNTSYDFSSINEGADFNEDSFLYYIAQEINNGNEEPGGGTGSGGSSPGGGGASASVENSGNITINNNNNLSQESLQYLNNIINNDASTDTDESVQSLLGDMSDMLDLVDGFKGLAATVFFFLPGAIKKLISVLFSAIIVLAIFRLIHLIV